MRKEKAVTLDSTRSARVLELRVGDVRRILGLLDAEQLQRPLPELLGEHLPDLLALLGDSLILPDGEALDDLSLSDCETIAVAWWGLHARFFTPLAGLARQALALAAPLTQTPTPSSAPASSASSAATPASGATAGPPT